MIDDPQHDDHQPFTVEELHHNTTRLLDHCKRNPDQHTAADVLQLVVTMLENTRCPHEDTCPRLLTEHPMNEGDQGK